MNGNICFSLYLSLSLFFLSISRFPFLSFLISHFFISFFLFRRTLSPVRPQNFSLFISLLQSLSFSFSIPISLIRYLFPYFLSLSTFFLKLHLSFSLFIYHSLSALTYYSLRIFLPFYITFLISFNFFLSCPLPFHLSLSPSLSTVFFYVFLSFLLILPPFFPR